MAVAPSKLPPDSRRGQKKRHVSRTWEHSKIDGVLSSMEQLERRSNKRFGYPRVFLNVVEFDEEFKRRVPLRPWRGGQSRKIRALSTLVVDSTPHRTMCRFDYGLHSFPWDSLTQSYKYCSEFRTRAISPKYGPFEYKRGWNIRYVHKLQDNLE
ncbi:hypothetical protein PM082_012528 [Marasmius tenuissimus]|nr:hypothetical protein PM082_012528 [Marasmius tenuissimus]